MTARAFTHPAPEYSPVAHRRIGIVAHGETLRCLNGHRLKDPLILEHGGIRCSHQGANGVPDCGMMLYVIGGTLHSPKGAAIWVVAEVTPEEMQHMTRARMDWHDALRFLGVYVGGEAEHRPAGDAARRS